MSASCISVAILDDDESLRRSLTRLMRAAGIEAVAYPSGEAFFLAERDRPDFDCLLVDVQFAGMSGIEFSRRLNDAGSKTPIVFITAFEDEEIRRQAMESGCAAFLRRNEPAQTVLAAIRKASLDKRADAP